MEEIGTENTKTAQNSQPKVGEFNAEMDPQSQLVTAPSSQNFLDIE